MRAAYVCADPGIPAFGRKGASVHVQAVLRQLVTRGMDVHLLTIRTGGDVPQGLEGIHLHRLPAVPPGDAEAREQAARNSDAAITGVLNAVHADSPLGLVYERYSLWGRTATAWAQAAGVPSVLEVNAPLVDEQANHRILVDREAADAVASDVLSTADVCVCVSEPVAQWVRARSRRPDRVAVVPNGVDIDRVTPARSPVTSADAAPLWLGFVGTLKPWHGVDVLLDALSVLNESEPGAYRLLLVGDGPQARALHERAREAGVDGLIEWTGAVAPDDVPALLRRMDVAVAPYPTAQGSYFSPLKVYEYLAAGLPIVASAVGQIPAALEQGRLGVLVEPGRADHIAAAVASLRSDTAMRATLRRMTRAAAVERHSWQRVVDRTLDALPGFVATGS